MKEAIVEQLPRLDRERIRGYQALLDFYHNRQWQGNARRGERRLSFNYAKVFVDKVTSYLTSGVNFAADPLADTEKAKDTAARAEAALYDVYEENHLAQLDLETELDCAILGDGCYKVTWDGEAKRVRVTSPDVQGLYAWWRGDNTAEVWRVASRYTLSGEEGEQLYGLKPQGKNVTVTEVWTERDFAIYAGDTLLEAKPNPYGFVPFVIFPNLREPKQFWGESDLTQIVESQRELNRAMSQLSGILELSGNPIAVLENVEGAEDIAIRPGAVWSLPEDARAYLLDLLQGGVGLHVNYIDLIYRTLHDLSESPRSAFGGTERDLSGIALEIELNPILQKVRRKRVIRTAAYNRRSRMILRLLEKYQGADYSGCRPRVLWGPVLPQDITRQVESEQVLVQTGLHSRRTAMDELGIRDPEAEFGQWLEEREKILRMNRNLQAKSTRSGARESAITAPGESAGE